MKQVYYCKTFRIKIVDSDYLLSTAVSGSYVVSRLQSLLSNSEVPAEIYLEWHRNLHPNVNFFSKIYL